MKFMGEGLYWMARDTKNEFFGRIDECGGWPHNAKSVVYKHCCEEKRPCYFSAGANIRDEWNTSIYSADEYYMWKLSPVATAEFELEIRDKIVQKILRYI